MVVARDVVTPVQRFLEDLHNKYATLTDGDVATYIPELSKADPEWFGICLVTLDGHEYAVGDAEVAFSIQSISKPFVFGLALEDHGEDHVLERVGLEPTGDAFNAISLDPVTGRPANAMINAGAIATSGMVTANGAEPSTRLLEAFGRYTGRALSLDESVYRSESETGHRNRAISHLLRNSGVISSSPEDALDLYFQQCSIAVTCRDLAHMAACLANNGTNPVTGEQAISSRYVDKVLSVMGSCGMYDYAGEWIYRVGMPAKSGVAGGVLAVLPGQFGIGVFSPRLDARGNSVRGVRVCTELSEAFNLHLFNVPQASRSGVRTTYHGGQVRSRRERGSVAADALAAADRIRVFELQGDQAFAAMEAFTRAAAEIAGTYDYLIVDLRRVSRLDAGAAGLFDRLVASLVTAGKTVALSTVGRLSALTDVLRDRGLDEAGSVLTFATLDLALEWCEDRLLARLAPAAADDASSVPLADNALLAGLLPDETEAVESVVRPLKAAPGDLIVTAGTAGQSVYLLTRGHVSVVLDGPDGEAVRVATLSPGMFFGEMAMLGETARAASIRADTDVECFEMPLDGLELVSSLSPNVRSVIYLNLARKLARNLRDANRQISALSA